MTTAQPRVPAQPNVPVQQRVPLQPDVLPEPPAPMPGSPSVPLRPRDTDAYRSALRVARQRIGVDMTFGGQVRAGDQLVLEEFFGTRTTVLFGLRVDKGLGVGGQVVEQGRPYAVNDYEIAAGITHDFDDPVIQEGVRAVVAAPVTVRGIVRGVIYAAARTVEPLGDRATASLVQVSRQLAAEIAVRDEVDRRVRLMETAALVPVVPTGLSRAEVLDLGEELRDIAAQVDDQALRQRLLTACGRLGAVVPGPGSLMPSVPPPVLAPREIDVLTEIARGCTNADAALRLSLQPETVKAYLRSACRKLGVSGRYQAVLAARAHGLIADGRGTRLTT